MSIENFTTYNEVDEASDIDVYTTRVTFDTMGRNVDSRVVYDEGAGYFAGDFTHKYQFRITYESSYGQANIWGLNNTGNKSLTDSRVDSEPVLHTMASYGPTLWLFARDGSNQVYDTGSYVVDTLYFVTVVYDADGGTNGTGRLTLYLCTGNYYGESGSSLVDTLVCDNGVGASMPSFEFIYAMSSVNHATSTYTISGYIQYLDLGEPAGAARPKVGGSLAGRKGLVA